MKFTDEDKILEEAREEISVDQELTELRNEASFLRKENFELKEKTRELEETIRDLRRNMAMMQVTDEEIEEIREEMNEEIKEDFSVQESMPKRWVAFGPTSYSQMRNGAKIKFTRGKDILTGFVCWVGETPKGSKIMRIGAETEEPLANPDDCGDLWEGDKTKQVLLALDKIIVAWDWETILPKL
ncbi:Oidioi.mRNA.OKI2018_I69.chr2.g5511.t1.cds [Oikopleura dioica]|uniref:Oidioi.mRNA.OKI2018_I69.chr2.g5511.t1.cds n=1 Tax=Oikopleura dioica TaxID=34765 RepID=A0ABN7T753_OIKDI|nr:Oidioi.mRNA.OKI2018_I69.chr2.g5511.t1.cds [Oikopleura dioica]